MLKSIITFFAAVTSAFGNSDADTNNVHIADQRLIVQVGDIIVQQNSEGWSAIKILAVDLWPDGSYAAHCLTYQSTRTKPTIESLEKTSVRVWHAPIDAASFNNGWEKIGNHKPSVDELVGFTEYLKLTDFPRYISFTGKDAKEIVRKANEHYKLAYALGEKGKKLESIAEYSQAIEMFPLFYEAIDNRAFTYMELGNYKAAISDFEESLRVNPDGVSAFFSKGECLMKLGQLKAAKQVFAEGIQKFPDQKDIFSKFLEQVIALEKNG